MNELLSWIQATYPHIYKMGWSGQTGWGTAIYSTFYMTFVSFGIGGAMGLVSGLFLVLTGPRGIAENRVIFWILDKVASILRGIPFIILLSAISPVTRAIVKTSIGMNAALVPLSLSVYPFFARQVQVVLSELDGGVIEAAQASGATFGDLIMVYFREGLPDLIRVTTLTLISLVGYTAMAGAIGAGGLGQVALSYGYLRSNDDVTFLATLLILIFIFVIQFVGDWITRKISHK
ncbi:methionine ABC transporter permease [Streptococcus azizii]|uniref:Methionine ABC transporter permease n=1 Tax=Streptococcus azizii TaxID=1579424 RepID=A0AB36JR20_9STRE|nr:MULTISPECIES: methionine ABC transporter permease [Streptococcus]MBF0775934.1 ABC transporter permease [Streptococcus sp. 19428wD3_AN2]ONK25590.1 methionine ABC transporter permease [Streptococcus azizii]ONK28246.1 methionine ABC transporter permease [Streptococcus azizii]ONK29016.1 methionine ABC transporter permease [Streptococcus azizii]TFU83737.1 ABC transporter permease [Streptococcus sp. AN2]